MPDLTFFATAVEQRRFLEACLSRPEAWAWLDDDWTGELSRCTADRVDSLRFDAPGLGWWLLLGQRNVTVEPVFALRAGQKRLDALRSCAVVFQPGLSAPGMLLEGRLAINTKGAYQVAGLDPAPVQRLYRGHCSNLVKALGAPAERAVTVAPNGNLHPTRLRLVVSAEARAAASEGVVLRPFLNSTVTLRPEP